MYTRRTIPGRPERKPVKEKSLELKVFLSRVKALSAERYAQEIEDSFCDGKATEAIWFIKKAYAAFKEVSEDLDSPRISIIPYEFRIPLKALLASGSEEDKTAVGRYLKKITKQFKEVLPTPYQEILARVKEMESSRDFNKISAFKAASSKWTITEEDLQDSIDIEEISSRFSEYVSPSSGIYSSCTYKTYKVTFGLREVVVEIPCNHEAYRIGS